MSASVKLLTASWSPRTEFACAENASIATVMIAPTTPAAMFRARIPTAAVSAETPTPWSAVPNAVTPADSTPNALKPTKTGTATVARLERTSTGMALMASVNSRSIDSVPMPSGAKAATRCTAAVTMDSTVCMT